MEIWRLSAGEIAGLVAEREVSVLEVVSQHLQRIEEINPTVNAIVRVLADQAREHARASDRVLTAGDPVGPLHGVPFTVKENIDLAGTPTTDGIPALKDAIAPMDAPIVKRLLEAGAIPVGRTNLPDMALRMHTESSLHGLTRNPWDPSRTAGGSSGADAVALVTGMTALGTGNDIGGSLRAPAHCCGVASIKPGFGRVAHARSVTPSDGSLAEQLMQVPGVMARTVSDVGRAFRAVAGADLRDPDAVEALGTRAGHEPVCRVAMMAEPPGGETNPEIAAAVRRAADALQAEGYEIHEATPPHFERCLELWSGWMSTELRARLPQLAAVMGRSGLDFLRYLLEGLPTLSIAEYLGIFVERHAVARDWMAFFDDFPLILAPVWTEPPFENGFDAASADNALAVLRLVRPVVPANLLGLPVAVVPAGRAGGMPVGVQLISARFEEERCLDAAEAIEGLLGAAIPVDPRPEKTR